MWLEKARFGPPAIKSSDNTSKTPTEFEVCSDDECPKQWALLKKNMDLIKEVWGRLQMVIVFS